MSHAPKGARLAERVRVHIASTLPTMKDPRIAFVTVTEVRMGADNEQATIYWTVFPDSEEDRKNTAKGLQSAKGILRRELGKVLNVRKVPELIFTYDDVSEKGRSIEDILTEVKIKEAQLAQTYGQAAASTEDTNAPNDETETP